MRAWQAVNPVNNLTYGYGGLKLIRRTALRKMGQALDVLAALPGRVSLLASHAVGPQGRVVAIEPSPQFHDDLTAAATTCRGGRRGGVVSAGTETGRFSKTEPAALEGRRPQ